MNDTARLAGFPLPLPDELSRPRLLERLNGRWRAIVYASVDPGDSVTFPELQVSIQNTLGTATIKCSSHATVDQPSLFPGRPHHGRVTSLFSSTGPSPPSRVLVTEFDGGDEPSRRRPPSVHH